MHQCSGPKATRFFLAQRDVTIEVAAEPVGCIVTCLLDKNVLLEEYQTPRPRLQSMMLMLLEDHSQKPSCEKLCGTATVGFGPGVVRDTHLAEDIVQESFVKLWRQPPEAEAQLPHGFAPPGCGLQSIGFENDKLRRVNHSIPPRLNHHPWQTRKNKQGGLNKLWIGWTLKSGRCCC